MEFEKNMYLLFREKFSKILEEIESSVFAFIEDLLSAKNLTLTDAIDYNSLDYQVTLKELVESIGFGLKSLNILPEKIQSGFLSYYTTFSPHPECVTYVDWITQEFQPKLQMLLFSEVMQFLVELPSNIDHLGDYSILSQRNLLDLKNIKNMYPNLILYLNSFLRYKDSVQKKVVEPELDYSTLFEFQDPEKDLQSLYIVYRLLEYFDIAAQFNSDALANFLLENTEKWTQQNPNVSEKYPMTLYCGIYLAKKCNIAIDINPIKENLKKILVSLVNNYKSPIFEDTFIVYYVLLACDLLDLKLTGKLITGLIRYDESVINLEFLKRLSTTRLATTYLVFDFLKLIPSYPEAARDAIDSILADRMHDKLVYDYDIDFMPTSEAIYGDLIIHQKNDRLNDFAFRENMTYLLKNLKENLIVLDFSLTGQLSEVYYAMQFIDVINHLQNYFVLSVLRNFTLGMEESLPAMQSPSVPPLSSSEKFKSIETSQSMNAFTGESTNELEEPSSPSEENLESQALIKPVVPKVIIEEETKPMGITERPGRRSVPKQFWDFFGDFPILHPDILDELKLQMAAISTPHEVVFGSLETLHQWLVILKILNIEPPLTKDDIYQDTTLFRKPNGFSTDTAEFVDPVNTFYGLSIYAEIGLLDRIDLVQIYEYLVQEAQSMNEYMLFTNSYIFMAMRILERAAVNIESFTHILTQIQNIDIRAQNDQVNILTDLLYYVNLIRAIDPNYDLSSFNENFLTEVQIAQEEDGSIQRLAVNTAKVLITLHELGLHGGSEGKFMLKYLQYEVKPFIETVKDEPIGWEKDPLGYLVELNLCYWVLLALTIIYPMVPPDVQAIVCPECAKYFAKKPKFCNNCGHSFA